MNHDSKHAEPKGPGSRPAEEPRQAEIRALRRRQEGRSPAERPSEPMGKLAAGLYGFF